MYMQRGALGLRGRLGPFEHPQVVGVSIHPAAPA